MAVNPTRADEDRPVRTLLSDKNFLCIWLVGGVTGVIRWFQLLAFGVYSFEITGSPLLVSAIPILLTDLLCPGINLGALKYPELF